MSEIIRSLAVLELDEKGNKKYGTPIPLSAHVENIEIETALKAELTTRGITLSQDNLDALIRAIAVALQNTHSATNITSGVLKSTLGGTGRSSYSSGYVLGGNASNQLVEIQVLTSLDANSTNPISAGAVTLAIQNHENALVDSNDGVHGIRYNTSEETLEVYDGSAWVQVSGGGSGGAIAIGDVVGATATALSRSVELTWTDPSDVMYEGAYLAKWAGTLVVRKEGSAPSSRSDGVVIVDNKTRDTYATEPLVDSGLTNGTTYYYRFFPYTDGKKYTDGSAVSATPDRILITTVPSQSGTLTYNGNSQTPNWSNYNTAQLTIGGDTSGTNAGTYTATFTPTDDYQWSDKTTAAKSVTWSIGKANGTVTLSASSVTLNSDGKSKTVTVSGNTGTVSVSTSDSAMATASISGSTITITSPSEKSGSATITVSVAEATNYKSTSKTIAVTCDFLQLVSWSTGTDDQIKAMVDAYYAGNATLADIKSVWKVGDVRTASLSAMSATGVGESHAAQSVQIAILDFDHDTLTTATGGKTKALVSLEQKDCFNTSSLGSGNSENGYMNSSNTNSGGWTSCARRTWCNSVYKAALPTYIQNLIKPVNKLTSAGSQSSTINTTSDSVWLPSEIEIFGSTTYSYAGEGSQYTYYQTTSNRYKKPAWTSSYSSNAWWERSPHSSGSNDFCSVGKGGAAGLSIASDACGLAPGFCF
jgi:hypothetical protein